MPGISKTGIKAHDDAVLQSEKDLQAAIAGNPSQATLNVAYLNHFIAVRDSAVFNGLTSQAVFYENARKQLAAHGSGPP
jgi:hypothetical protein